MHKEWRDCYADWSGGVLVIGNSCLERTWRWTTTGPQAVSLRGKRTGAEWIIPAQPSNIQDVIDPDCVVEEAVAVVPGAGECLLVTLSGAGDNAEIVWSFRILPDADFILQQVCREPNAGGGSRAPADSVTSCKEEGCIANAAAPTGVENDAAACAKSPATPASIDRCESFGIHGNNLIVHAVRLQDQTDHYDNLLQWNKFRIGPVERLALSGCVFALENPLTRAGVILLKHAPLPHARAAGCECDLKISGQSLELLGQGTGAAGEGYPWAVILFTGGEVGITRALQRERQLLHPYRVGRDGLVISNTWGDRNRDGALSEEFIKKEIRTARELSADACQIDDGWQKGVSSNSVDAAKGGVWEGFYAADPEFWAVNAQRLPNGLSPLVQEAKANGVGLGLWFSPDSAHDFANWRKDADTILRFHREYGVGLIKIDGVKSRTKEGECNLRRFFAAVLEESAGGVLFDQDVTAEVRPGYFGRPEAGPLFVENRYTDWGRYWPHATLRTLWQLTKVLPPVTLRMEWLNPERNLAKYENDPLAPGECGADYSFAGILAASPLLWCELSNLSEPVKRKLGGLIRLWKPWRQELHTATVYPAGQEPDGGSWTGFWAADEGGAYLHLIALRECAATEDYEYELPTPCAELLQLAKKNIRQVAGAGSVRTEGGRLRVNLPQKQSFGWWRLG